MQLIQPYVQKSSSMTFPRRDSSVSALPPVCIQSRPDGNPGARTRGRSCIDRDITLHSVTN
jgi:hypothetical protein